MSATSGFLVLWGSLFGGIGGGLGCLFLVIGLASLQLVFAGVGALVLLVFGGIGGAALAFGWRKASRELRTFRIGEPVEATLIATDVDTSTTINGRHPIRVSYTFTWQGEERGGECATLDARARRFQQGDAVIILVDPAGPENQALFLK